MHVILKFAEARRDESRILRGYPRSHGNCNLRHRDFLQFNQGSPDARPLVT
ncbi:hypothetical protein RESH_02612 [Rhodopirellula europaea SH398]|uniref:Uncharacterized protein n=1 Tax=Rhodopirellula europaea SH398 TaxID=1263868 RepID=M5SKH3_9BACT|nr:hypothetical protein RESH_02612 [Rhodopirellula europaea SH398]